MRRRGALVERIVDLSRLAPDREAELPAPPENYVDVRFESGESGLLDMSLHHGAVWADVLRSLQRRRQPAYVVIDPETRLITELLLPFRVTVGSIDAIEDGLVVELIISHAPHYLFRSNEDFDELRKTLEVAKERQATVLVTETDEHEIVDIRPVDESPESLA